jgi:hypothetical protein
MESWRNIPTAIAFSLCIGETCFSVKQKMGLIENRFVNEIHQADETVAFFNANYHYLP